MGNSSSNPDYCVVFAFTVLGIRAFQALPINTDPDMRFPMVNITVTQTEASADELENTVTRRVEDAVAGMAGVRHITSTITEGSSVTTVEDRAKFCPICYLKSLNPVQYRAQYLS